VSVPQALLTGNEPVLVALVPKASGRWHQTHWNAEVMRRFFRMQAVVGSASAIFERVSRKGRYGGQRKRPLVYSDTNKNLKIEFDLPDAEDYPPNGPPILLVLELGLRHFRYQLLMPDDDGYDEMYDLNQSLVSMGKGHRRGMTTLDEVELRWPECPLRYPLPPL
jgi:hypothetical protein